MPTRFNAMAIALSLQLKRLDEQAKILHSLEGQLKGMADNNNLILEILLKKGD